MHKRKATVSCRIWTILPWWAKEFCEPAHKIWQNLLRKTVGPTNHHFAYSHNSWSRISGAVL